MLIVISPAKTLDLESAYKAPATSQPAFLSDTRNLVKIMRGHYADDLAALMHTSDAISTLNADRFKQWKTPFKESNARPSIFTFMGDVYTGFEAQKLSQNDLDYAQSHLRILSGLYGVLRPLDAIQPYRLEMGSRLKTRRGKNLYEYWGSDLSSALNAQAEVTGSDVLVNCASQEYFGAVDLKTLKLRVITPQFMEDKGDGKGPKIVSFFAKKARGAMARFVMQNRIVETEGLFDFDTGGYVYTPSLSKPDVPVFLRPYPVS